MPGKPSCKHIPFTAIMKKNTENVANLDISTTDISPLQIESNQRFGIYNAKSQVIKYDKYTALVGLRPLAVTTSNELRLALWRDFHGGGKMFDMRVMSFLCLL